MAVAVSDVATDGEGSVGVGAGGAVEVGVGSEVDCVPAVGVGFGEAVAVGVGVGVGGSEWRSARPWCWGSASGSPSTRPWSWGSVWWWPGVRVAVGVGVDVSPGVSSSASAVASGVTSLRLGSEPSRGVGVVVTSAPAGGDVWCGSARAPGDVVARVRRLRPAPGRLHRCAGRRTTGRRPHTREWHGSPRPASRVRRRGSAGSRRSGHQAAVNAVASAVSTATTTARRRRLPRDQPTSPRSAIRPPRNEAEGDRGRRQQQRRRAGPRPARPSRSPAP